MVQQCDGSSSSRTDHSDSFSEGQTAKVICQNPVENGIIVVLLNFVM